MLQAPGGRTRQKLVGNACRKGIDGKDSSGNGARRVRLFKSRILHLTAEAIAQRAVEAVALTVDELVFDVGLIEKDEVDAPGLICHADLDQLHALADARELGIGDHHRLKAGGDSGLETCDRGDLCPVFIGAGKEGNEIVERFNMKPLQLLCARGTDAGEVPSQKRTGPFPKPPFPDHYNEKKRLGQP